jgi:hypothetical protein
VNRELEIDVSRIIELINSGILATDSPFTESVFTELIIKLNYILQKLSSKNKRITFTDNIKQTKLPRKKMDITDLVNKMRGAICHIDSTENYLDDSTRFTFNRISGKSPNAFSINGRMLGCDFDNDIAFYYGEDRIYLNRHLKRVIEIIVKLI